MQSNFFLIGYRATGKSTVARELAARLGAPAADADAEIVRRAGKAIAEIFAEEGEQAFRDLETIVVKELAAREGVIVALGGGAMMREENRRALAGRGMTIWLRASVATIQERLRADPSSSTHRPGLTSRGTADEVAHVLAERTPVYAACADAAIDVDRKSPAAIAEEIVALLNSPAHQRPSDA
ncbi:MAG: shikimate kinase [Planctomycetes bacterium]|nr:shikimate kinase [Planctomycetota bacterium]